MAKKKNTSLLVKIILLVLAALMVVSIFTNLIIVKETSKITDETTTSVTITGQDTFETMFEGHEYDFKQSIEEKNAGKAYEEKNAGKAYLKLFASGNDGEHKFITVMLEICFVVTVIAGLACLVLSLLSLLGINLGLINKIVALVFFVGAVATFVFALIVSNVMVKDSQGVTVTYNGLPGIGAWFALISGVGYGITYLATNTKR